MGGGVRWANEEEKPHFWIETGSLSGDGDKARREKRTSRSAIMLPQRLWPPQLESLATAWKCV